MTTSIPVPLQLANALAACVLSNRLGSSHRQWAAQQLVNTVASMGQSVETSQTIESCDLMVDLVGELIPCQSIKLEAHQNRVTGCVFNKAKALLASR